MIKESMDMISAILSSLFTKYKKSCKKHANRDIEANPMYNTKTGPMKINKDNLAKAIQI